MAMNHIDCVHCLGERTAELRLDRKNRPYTRCAACGALAFLPTSASLRGLVFLVPRARAVFNHVAQMGQGELMAVGERALTSIRESGGLGGVDVPPLEADDAAA